jgi:DegV family protein with EDD domain
MAKIKIFSDSTMDLPKSYIDEHNISIVPLYVRFGEESYKDMFDLDSDAFYRKMAQTTVFPSTSQPSPQDFVDAYRPFVDEGYGIVSIHISSKLSGSYNSAVQAAKMLSGADITVIDGMSASIGTGLIVLAAARAAKEGKSKQEVLDIANSLIPKVRVIFTVDSLDHLQRGGRIGKAQAFLGSVLNVKPLLILEDGVIHPKERVRGQAKLFRRVLEVVGEDIKKDEGVKVALIHAGVPDTVERLKKEIETSFKVDELILSKIGSVIGAHTGPGAWGVIYHRV